ncbi:MAG: diguanylate cyclase [Oscillospiraceae bacterium]|nr:diguanylate cyclase [Oscillospiraceae bacterium]
MKKILIVDDNKLNLTVAKNVLRSIYEVTAVTNGADALEAVGNQGFDLILLDINMPEMDGFEVLEKLKSDSASKDIPIIFLTADSDADTETKCFESGALDFIAKPFVPEVMRSRISRILELEDLRKSLAKKLLLKTQEVEDIQNKSQKDALTGLWNRNYTEKLVDEFFENGENGALMMIDMDNFKAINDNYGHIAGDRTLKMFAETLEKYCGKEDVLCRIGGDEFVVFVRSARTKNELSNLAGDILADLCRKLDECKFETNSSVSIGIAQSPADGKEFKELYNSADKALYYVKQNGKNSFHFYSDKKKAEDSRTSNAVDLNYLREIMGRTDSGHGAYLMDYDNFHHVYNFIRRFVERNNHDVSTLLFTAVSAAGGEPEISEVEAALEILEKAIYNSLRRVDVSTRYSSKQLIVILMNANAENSEMVAQRIIDVFNKLYTNGKIRLEYGIAQMNEESNLFI